MPFVADLASHGDRAALYADDRCISYAELAAMVERTARSLGTVRRLVLVEGGNTVESVVTYLAALSAGHPVLLVPGDNPEHRDALARAYAPDVIARRTDDGWLLDDRRDGSGHELHPDLALLLSTSGSTGSPKLVRLSGRNVQANAAAIARYLGIRPSDRAVTTLPLHYCYGLSILNSHLLAGAAVVLTDLSVTDGRFWDLMRRQRVTTFGGVPYTFELLDRVGFADMDLPHLRYVTQAGGRLHPDAVRRYAELGQRRGWDLFVMYGQTEATARMAYLPPELAQSRPASIGLPVPGGAFELRPAPGCAGPDTGELVYSGPNVMLGYATSPADLGLGATIDRLHTGDLARRTGDGLFEIIGRCSRFAKVFGLRLDLDRIEDHLAGGGVTACCVEAGDALVVAVQGTDEVERVREDAARFCGLPSHAVRVRTVDALPRLGNGKPDHAAVRALAAGTPSAPRDLVALFAGVLGCPEATADSTFVSLGGDSLSYVTMSVRLEQVLGRLPADWPTTRIGDLAAASVPARRGRAVETGVLLRAACIVLVVAGHIGLLQVLGGAHVLLAVAGFNFARFTLTDTPAAQRLRRGLRSLARIAAPSVAFIAVATAVTGLYDIRDVLLTNDLLGTRTAGRFWFIECLCYLLLAVTVLMSCPPVLRLERRFPFAVPVGLVLLGLLTRYQIVGDEPGPMRIYSAHTVFWVFALGWAAARAVTPARRALVAALVLVTVPGFFAGDHRRDWFVVAGLLLLTLVPAIRVPAVIGHVAVPLAAASLPIYLTHWHVYPYVQPYSPALALAASLAVGVGCWWLATRLTLDRPGLGALGGSCPAGTRGRPAGSPLARRVRSTSGRS
ncbi:MAG TPA: AMP-binding protein [Mycobacteriales bacterium]